MFRPFASLLAASCVALATAAVAAPQARWTLVEIPAIASFGSSTPLGVNNRGQVVGYATAPDPVQTTAIHGFVWDNGTMIDMGRTPTGFPISTARAINDRGTVLGGDGLGREFSWTDGTWSPLPVNGAKAINKFGAIGGSYWASTATHGYVYRDGVFTDIGTLGGFYSDVMAMNDKATVVGKSLVAGNTQFHPYVYENGVMKDLGTFGGNFGVALGVNNRGEVVGATYDGVSMMRAFIYDGSAIRKLLPDSAGQSQAVGINDHGAVIGWLIGAAGLAFVYDNGVLTMLDQIPQVRAAGLEWLVPTGINDRGWIIGSARRIGTFNEVGFVLMPK